MTKIEIRKSREPWLRSWLLSRDRNQSSWVKARNKILVEAGDLAWGLAEMGYLNMTNLVKMPNKTISYHALTTG